MYIVFKFKYVRLLRASSAPRVPIPVSLLFMVFHASASDLIAGSLKAAAFMPESSHLPLTAVFWPSWLVTCWNPRS